MIFLRHWKERKKKTTKLKPVSGLKISKYIQQQKTKGIIIIIKPIHHTNNGTNENMFYLTINVYQMDIR